MIERKDPYGYYVVFLNKECLGKEIDKLLSSSIYKNIVVEEYGNTVIVRTKSRSIADRLAKTMKKCIEPPE